MIFSATSRFKNITLINWLINFKKENKKRVLYVMGFMECRYYIFIIISRTTIVGLLPNNPIYCKEY